MLRELPRQGQAHKAASGHCRQFQQDRWALQGSAQLLPLSLRDLAHSPSGPRSSTQSLHTRSAKGGLLPPVSSGSRTQWTWMLPTIPQPFHRPRVAPTHPSCFTTSLWLSRAGVSCVLGLGDGSCSCLSARDAVPPMALSQPLQPSALWNLAYLGV